MRRSLSEGWVLEPSADLTSQQLGAGIAALDQALKGGPQQAISSAIMELLGACDRPPQLDDGSEAARILALKNMAWDYPVDVVQLACRNWRRVPNYGRWWPTEQDLRAQCEPLVEPQRSLRNKAAALKMQLEAQEQRREAPSPFAGDKCGRFRNAMRQRMLPRTFNAYFDPTHIAYRENAILVRSRTAERVLRERGGDLAEQLGLRIEFSPMVFLNVRDPSYEDDTPQEREETAARFHRLKEAMQKGENIKKLREEGAL